MVLWYDKNLSLADWESRMKTQRKNFKEKTKHFKVRTRINHIKQKWFPRKDIRKLPRYMDW